MALFQTDSFTNLQSVILWGCWLRFRKSNYQHRSAFVKWERAGKWKCSVHVNEQTIDGVLRVRCWKDLHVKKKILIGCPGEEDSDIAGCWSGWILTDINFSKWREVFSRGCWRQAISETRAHVHQQTSITRLFFHCERFRRGGTCTSAKAPTTSASNQVLKSRNWLIF